MFDIGDSLALGWNSDWVPALADKFSWKNHVGRDTRHPDILAALGDWVEPFDSFSRSVLDSMNEAFPVVFHVPAVIIAQFAVASAFAVRTLRNTFDSISPRLEQVALTLGCRRSQAFFWVVLPQAWRGILTAGTLAWARSLGEFGPILVFAGSTRKRTEVLPVSVHLELSIGNIEGAVGISLLMVAIAMIVLVVVRVLGGANRDW